MAAGVLGVVALIHCILTFVLYDRWSPDSVWFLGTGLALLLLAVVNWSHVGSSPGGLPAATVVRWANFAFVAFGVGAAVAVPQPQAYVLLAALVLQAAAGIRTLK